MIAKQRIFELGKRHIGSAFWTVAVLIFGFLWASSLYPGDAIATTELQTQLRVYWPGVLVSAILLVAWQFVEAAKTIDTMQRTDLALEKRAREVEEERHAEAVEKLALTESELKKALDSKSAIAQDLNRHKLVGCGFKLESKNLTIAIHYMDSTNDRRLGESFRREFGRTFTRIPWSRVTLDNAPPLTDNPSGYSRIVMFSNDDAREGIAAALTEVLGLEVVAWNGAIDGQEADIEIIIFDHPVTRP